MLSAKEVIEIHDLILIEEGGLGGSMVSAPWKVPSRVSSIGSLMRA
jgi:hypothetical protein